MNSDSALRGYVACLLRFEGEDNDQALSRIVDHYVEGVSTVVDSIYALSFSGIAMTPRMLEDATGYRADQTGLAPDSISMYLDILGRTTEKLKLDDIGRKLIADHDIQAAIAALSYSSSSKTSTTLTLDDHITIGHQLFMERQERIRSGAVSFRFPWVRLNDKLPYVYNDDLLLLSGESKVGKSSGAHQIAIRNALHFPVVYFHNEDNELKVHMRRLAQMQYEFDPKFNGTGLCYPDLINNTIKSDAMLAAIARTEAVTRERLDDRLVYVYCSGWTPEQICAEWYRLRRQREYGLVVIDYLNKIEMSHLIKTRNSVAYAMDHTVELFKRQCGLKGFQTPCLLVQQENEDGGIRDSKSPYIKAQAHISLRRSPEGDSIALVRANDGEPGEIPAKFYHEYMLWIG